MQSLKIYVWGTKYFMDTYAGGLQSDCDRYGYALTTGVVPDADNFSHINHYIHKAMVDTVNNADPSDRILFLDPECRIVKPIPEEWIQMNKPIMCYKIADGKHDINLYEYGHTLHGPIQMQPIFLTAEDSTWIQWWYDASMAGSDPDRNVYVPHELFLELAIKFNKVDAHREYCVYNREWKQPQRVVKGSYVTEHTIITHPDIHALFDPHVKHSVQKIKDSPFMPPRKLHNHFNDFTTIKQIDELMFREQHDITKWPEGTTKEGNWYCIDDWQFDPRTGRLKHKDYDAIKYHISIDIKTNQNLNTPAVKSFFNSYGVD